MKWLLALALIVAAYLNYPMPAHAGDRLEVTPLPSYSPKLAVEREEVLRQMYDAHRCMYDGSVAMFRQGVLDRHAVTMFTLRNCSLGIGIALNRAGYKQDDAATMIVAMSDRAYDDALSWGKRRK